MEESWFQLEMNSIRHSIEFAYSGIKFRRESKVKGIFVGMSTFCTVSEGSDEFSCCFRGLVSNQGT